MASSHTEASIGAILTSLFQLTPATLSPAQISSNLATRHRLLGMAPVPPAVLDLDLGPGSEEHYTSASREELGEWLVTRTHSDVEAAEAMELLFVLRDQLRSGTGELESRIVIRQRYAGDRVRLDLRQGLTLLLAQEGQGITFENLVPSKTLEEQDHLWTEQAKPPPQQDESGAEYINDANDFWQGFSEEEEEETSPHETKGKEEEQDEGDYWGSYGADEAVDTKQLEEENRSLRTKLRQVQALIQAAKMVLKSDELERMLEQMEQITLES